MIIRSKRTQNFTVIPNSVLEDKNLDWKALGLLVYLLSKPDDWSVSVPQLIKAKKAGEDAIRGMLKALRDAGYVDMQRSKSGEVDWLVYDTPHIGKNPNRENPDEATESKATSGKSQTGKIPNGENPDVLIKTDKTLTKTEESATRVALHLHERLVEEIPEIKTNPQSWVTDIERAIRLDGRTEQDLIDIIDWMHQGDKFWVGNIQSGKKLREKYNTMIAQKRQREASNETRFRADKQNSYLDELAKLG